MELVIIFRNATVPIENILRQSHPMNELDFMCKSEMVDGSHGKPRMCTHFEIVFVFLESFQINCYFS